MIMYWISVEDRLPADGGRILVAVYGTDDEGMREESGVFFALYKDGRFFVFVDDELPPEFDLFISRGTSIFTVWGMRYEITHWMPLPELPMEKEDKPKKPIGEEYSNDRFSGGWGCSDEEYNYSAYVRDVLNAGR